MQTRHLTSVHVLRLLGSLAVITIHSTAPVLYLLGTADPLSWWLTNLSNSFSRWAVPVFILISGLLLLNETKQESWQLFYKKRLLKIAIPSMFWYILYLIAQYAGPKYSLSFDNVLHTLLKNPPHIHLYFIFIIVGLYLFTPLLRHIKKSLSAQQFLFVTVLTSIVTILWKETPFVGILWVPFIAYYLLGSLLEKYTTAVKPWLAISLYVLSSVVIAGGTYYLFSIGSSYPVYFYGYMTPLVFIQSLALFCFFLHRESLLSTILKTHIKTVAYLSSLSFGVYLAAPLVQDGWWYLFSLYNPSFYITALGCILHIILTVVSSFALVIAMKHVPYLRRVV